MELLAPAGSILALKAAIHAGADAVYLGLGEHNARIKASDFTKENLKEWVDYAHLFGVKVYVTLNTAVKEEEFGTVLGLASVAVNAEADALIVSDLGLAKVLSKSSSIPIHLSTQAGVQNTLDLEALRDIPIKRVILARESVLSDISEIKKHIDEVEVFAQGALCVAFSGGCLLGSKIYGYSGNRGVCNQACRLSYVAKDAAGKVIKKGKLLSPVDLCVGKQVKLLQDVGVDSIKIEGRLKRPAYVYAAVKYYRDLLDGKEVAERDLHALSESFNRGYTDGYALCKSKKIINVKTSSHIGVRIGTVLSVNTIHGYKFARVQSDYLLQKGDGIKILRDGIEVGGSDVTSVREDGNGTYIIPVSDDVKKGDELRLTTNAAAVRAAESLQNKLPLEIKVQGKVGQPLCVTMRSGSCFVSALTQFVAQKASSAEGSPIIDKLSKVGDTIFFVEKVTDCTEEPLFIRTAELNAVRRMLLEKLEMDVKSSGLGFFRKHIAPFVPSLYVKKEIGKVFEISDLTLLPEYKRADAFVLSPPSLDEKSVEHFVSIVGAKRCYLRLPRILRGSELSFLQDFITKIDGLGIYTDNLYGVALARNLGRGYIAGFGLNVFNTETAALFQDADAVASSVEYPMAGDLFFRAGKVALMSFAHCPFSVCYGYDCANCKGHSYMTYENEDARYLMIKRKTASCDFTMYEDKISVYPKKDEGRNAFYRFVGLNSVERESLVELIKEDIGE